MGSEAQVQRVRLCVCKGKLLSIVRASESIRNQSYSNRQRSGLATVWFIESMLTYFACTRTGQEKIVNRGQQWLQDHNNFICWLTLLAQELTRAKNNGNFHYCVSVLMLLF